LCNNLITPTPTLTSSPTPTVTPSWVLDKSIQKTLKTYNYRI
jgi:hypothetical protein